VVELKPTHAHSRVKSSEEDRSRAKERAEIIMLNVASASSGLLGSQAAVVRSKVPEVSRDVMNMGTLVEEAVASCPKDCDLAW